MNQAPASSDQEQTMDIGPSRTCSVSSPCAMSITALRLHPCFLARPTSETTYAAENQAGSLDWSCCLPPRSSRRNRNPGSCFYGRMSPLVLLALALQGMELHADKMQCRGFGAGAFHFPKFPQAERADFSGGSVPDQTILTRQFCRCC